MTTLEYLPYSPALAPAADFYLLPRLKSGKGQGFCDATDINRNVLEGGTSLDGVYAAPLFAVSVVGLVDHHICLCVPLHKHYRTGIFPVKN